MLRASFAFIALGSVLPAQVTPSSDTAVGVFPFLVGNMDGQINRVVSELVQNDIDTLYVSVFRATGPMTGDLWITDRAGDWNSSWGPVRPSGAGIDLPALIAAAHAQNLRVVGVLKCFDGTVQPNHQGHKQYLLDVIDYLVNDWQQDGRPTYDLDGLALDYIRFVGSGTGNSPTYVTNFLADIRQVIGSLSLHAYLIANRYTFDGPNYNGQFASYSQVIAGLSSQFGQNWEQMARYVDVMMPMTYTADGSIYNTYNLHQAYVRQAASYCNTACTVGGYPWRRVQPVIRTYTGGSETCTAQTIDASITGARLGSADGYQSFRWGHLTQQPSWWAKMKQYAVPGPNWPVPGLQITMAGLSGTFDASSSRDFDEPSSQLQARFDWDNDGVLDTPWLPGQVASRAARYPGASRLALQVKDSDGHVSTTTRQFTAPDILSTSQTYYSALVAGALDIRIDAGPQTAGATYFVLASLSGTSPGTVWQGLPLPLNVDWLTEAMFGAANTPILMGGIGLLDAQGRGTATFQVAPGLLTPLAFTSSYWSGLAMDAQGNPVFTANAKTVLIIP